MEIVVLEGGSGLFGVTILSLAVGGVPLPADEILSALAALEAVHGVGRSLSDRIATGFEHVLRFTAAVMTDATYRPRTHGLSERELHTWATDAQAALSAPACQSLLEYAAECREWYRRLHDAIGDDATDPDWDMTSAKKVEPSAPEAYLAQTLEERGVPVQAQVGVSRQGGARRGGWFASYWLDCAHRDVAYLLRIDIELDGSHHYRRARQSRDEERNRALQERGWYVVRVGGRILGQRNHHLALDQLVSLVERHRRAIILARSDRRALESVVQAIRASAPEVAHSQLELPEPPMTPPRGSPIVSGNDSGAEPIASAARVCPRCAGALVLRTARQGPHAGSLFYGCSNFPRCRYMAPAE